MARAVNSQTIQKGTATATSSAMAFGFHLPPIRSCSRVPSFRTNTHM